MMLNVNDNGNVSGNVSSIFPDMRSILNTTPILSSNHKADSKPARLEMNSLIEIPPGNLAGVLGDGQQQMVNIAEALHQESTLSIGNAPYATPERKVYGKTVTGYLR
jgi:ABC-type phosphate/phosphonate transport system ATPase subunit